MDEHDRGHKEPGQAGEYMAGLDTIDDGEAQLEVVKEFREGRRGHEVVSSLLKWSNDDITVFLEVSDQPSAAEEQYNDVVSLPKVLGEI